MPVDRDVEQYAKMLTFVAHLLVLLGYWSLCGDVSSLGLRCFTSHPFALARLMSSFSACGLFLRLSVGLLHLVVGDVGFVPCGIAVVTGGHVEGRYEITAHERGCR